MAVPEDIKYDTLLLTLDFHPNKDILAVGTIDGEVDLWSLKTEEANQKALELSYHKKSCRAVKFSADGEILFTVSADKSIQGVDLTNGAVVHKLASAHNSAIYCLEYIDDYLIATGDDDGTVKVWDYRRQNAIMEMKQVEEFVSSLTISSNKRILLATSGDGTLTAFNVRGRRMELQSEEFETEFFCGTFVKDYQKFVVGTAEGALNIFNWNEWGNISDRYPNAATSVDCIAKITDEIICIGSTDGKISAVNLFPNRSLGIVGEHGDFPIEDVAASHDKQLLASCSHDQTVKFWNIEFLQNLEVSAKRKAKRQQGKKHLQSSRKQDFFADLVSDT